MTRRPSHTHTAVSEQGLGSQGRGNTACWDPFGNPTAKGEPVGTEELRGPRRGDRRCRALGTGSSYAALTHAWLFQKHSLYVEYKSQGRQVAIRVSSGPGVAVPKDSVLQGTLITTFLPLFSFAFQFGQFRHRGKHARVCRHTLQIMGRCHRRHFRGYHEVFATDLHNR